MNVLPARVLAVVIVACALLSPAPSSATQVLVRPMDAEGTKGLDALRKRLQVTSETLLPSLPARVWVSALSPKAIEDASREQREHIATEVLTHELGLVAWPVPVRELSAEARANYERVLKHRTYADPKRTGVVKMLSPPFAGPMLRNGLRPERGLPARWARWKLFDDLTIVSARTGVRLRAGGFSWIAELDPPAAAGSTSRYDQGFAAATYVAGQVYARIEHGGSIYQLLPLGDRYHAVLRVDPAKVYEAEAVPGKQDARPPQADLAPRSDCSVAELDRPASADTGGGELDKVKDADSGGGELDRIAGADTGGGELDKIRDADTGGGELDKVKDADTGGGELDAVGFCTVACGGAAPTRGTRCDEGPRTCATIRIGVGVTRQALAQLPAILPGGLGSPQAPTLSAARHYAQYLVDLTAASFARSGVFARVALSEVALFDDLEGAGADAWGMVKGLISPSASPSFQKVQQWRTASGSDVVILLSTLEGGPQGELIGGMSPPNKLVRDPRSAYSLVVARFADAQLSFLHELGHHLGAYHDPQEGITPPFAYAQGFRHQCEWRTVMAYSGKECAARGVPRLALWSSCNLWHRGVAAGNPGQNNVRIINRMSGWVAGFRP